MGQNSLSSAEEEERKADIIKQKRVLRRYLRLKRNNFAKKHEELLTDRFYIKNYLPKIEQIFTDEDKYLRNIAKDRPIEISSYSPISYEMNITPVIAKLLENPDYNLKHSLPVVMQQQEPLAFREYRWGDDLVKSHLFKVLEPTEDKKQVYPQVLIVPLMGFMPDCHRIGYGGGFYDRTIEELRKMHDNHLLMIGVCFEAQKFDRFRPGDKASRLAGADMWEE